jgi:hypothetical protein
MATIKNSPTHTAYQVREYKSSGEDKASWTRIGSAWAHNDGAGFNIRLDAFPVDGNIVLRTVKEKQPTEEESAVQ